MGPGSIGPLRRQRRRHVTWRGVFLLSSLQKKTQKPLSYTYEYGDLHLQKRRVHRSINSCHSRSRREHITQPKFIHPPNSCTSNTDRFNIHTPSTHILDKNYSPIFIPPHPDHQHLCGRCGASHCLTLCLSPEQLVHESVYGYLFLVLDKLARPRPSVKIILEASGQLNLLPLEGAATRVVGHFKDRVAQRLSTTSTS